MMSQWTDSRNVEPSENDFADWGNVQTHPKSANHKRCHGYIHTAGRNDGPRRTFVGWLNVFSCCLQSVLFWKQRQRQRGQQGGLPWFSHCHKESSQGKEEHRKGSLCLSPQEQTTISMKSVGSIISQNRHNWNDTHTHTHTHTHTSTHIQSHTHTRKQPNTHNSFSLWLCIVLKIKREILGPTLKQGTKLSVCVWNQLYQVRTVFSCTMPKQKYPDAKKRSL